MNESLSMPQIRWIQCPSLRIQRCEPESSDWVTNANRHEKPCYLGNQHMQPARRVYTLQSQQQLHLYAFYASGVIRPLSFGNAFSVGKHSKHLEFWVSGNEFLKLVCKKQFWKAGGPAASRTLSLHDFWRFTTLICIKTKEESLK